MMMTSKRQRIQESEEAAAAKKVKTCVYELAYVAFCSARVNRYILSCLADLDAIKKLRYVCKGFSKACLNYLLNVSVFSLDAIMRYEPRVATLGLGLVLPRVPKRVYCVIEYEKELLEGCEELVLNFVSHKKNELVWPRSVKKIVIQNMRGIEQSICEKTLCLPEGMTHVILKSCEVKEGETIEWPKTLEHATVVYNEGGSILRALPRWLKSLTLIDPFCKSLKGLPPSLEILDIRGVEDCAHPLPSSIRKLYMPGAKLDRNPKYLCLHGCLFLEYLDALPDSLKDLDLSELRYVSSVRLVNQ